MITFDQYNAGIDLPDSRDIGIEEIGMGIIDISKVPRKVHYKNTPILNQGSIGACTVFGTSGALFETSFIDADDHGVPYNQPYDPWTRWSQAKERGASDTQGWSLQGAIQLLADKKDIVGYARVATRGANSWELLVSVLANKKTIATGSQKWDWGKIGVSPYIYQEKTSDSGHIWAIVGYDLDKRHFICRNSWTQNWGDQGHFYLSFDDVGFLYSTYILLDPSDAAAFREVRNVKAQTLAKKAQDAGVWNGTMPEVRATDEEIMLMIHRSINVMGLQTRVFYANLFTEKILRGKWQLAIYNEKEKARKPTLKELSTMFARAVTRNPNGDALNFTRFQVAAVCGGSLLP
jgi:Papain family cysteine protease